MSYKALYLAYRPQTFDEVAGQAAVVRTLKNSLSTGRIAHAYLFAGPRGTGKTTMARLLAKALNCEEGLGHQCCRCSNCIDIASGEHPDVVEIDAASNNGVDQVRELIEKVRYAPIRARYKVYIIDEVHMMSAGAFNALLKTLEEPPENVIFILATTEVHKVLPTIVSRCQRFDFTRVEEKDMERKLREVLSKENANYDEDALKEVIALSDGGMRDALSILDQVLAYSGGYLRMNDVLDIYGLLDKGEKIRLLEALSENNAGDVLDSLNAYRDRGIDIRRLNDDLVAILKDGLAYSLTEDKGLLTYLTEEEAREINGRIGRQKANDYLAAFLKNASDFKSASSVSTLFEISLLTLMSGPVPAPIAPQKEATPPKTEEIPVQKDEKPVFAETPQKPAPEKKTEQAPKKPAIITKPQEFLFDNDPEEETPIDASGVSALPLATSGESYEISDDELIKIMVLGDKAERTALVPKWAKLEPLKVDLKLGPLANLLSQGNPFCLCKQAIILTYKFKGQKEKANLKANQKPLEELLEVLLGRKVFIIAIDHNDQNRLWGSFTSLQQIRKLPSKAGIVLNLPKVE